MVANVNDPNYAYDKAIDHGRHEPREPEARQPLRDVDAVRPRDRGAQDGPDGIRAISPIYFSQSSDGGATWSAGVEISGMNPASAVPSSATMTRALMPVIGPDGTIYVSFVNRDSPDGIEQVLFVSCPPSSNCSDRDDWSVPVRVARIFGSHPTGPSGAGCPLGSQCLPPNGYAVNQATSDLALRRLSPGICSSSGPTFETTRTQRCRGNAQTARPPCDNDVFYAHSTDGGLTWSEPRSITPRSNPRFGETAQWQPWSAMASNGHLWVAFYDRSYGNCELAGLQRHHDGRDHEPDEPEPDDRLFARDDRFDAEPDDLEQSARGRLPGRPAGPGHRQPQSSAYRLGRHPPSAGADPEEDVYYARVPALPPPRPPLSPGKR